MGTGLRRQRKRVVGRAACPHPATHTLHSEGPSATTVNLQLIENVKDAQFSVRFVLRNLVKQSNHTYNRLTLKDVSIATRATVQASTRSRNLPD